MSTIWTPGGEHEPRERSGPEEQEPADSLGDGSGVAEEEAVAEQLRQLRRELAEVPVADVVANHVVGLWQLAIVHLAPEGDAPPKLEEARLAIDAMAALVEGLADRLGPHGSPLQEALAQLRLAYVNVSRPASDDSGAP